MRSLKLFVLTAMIAGVVGLTGTFTSAQEKVKDKVEKKAEPKYTVKEVMKEAHVGGLLNKVAGGKAEKADVVKLVDLYEALANNTPKKGDAEKWKTITGEIVVAAKEVADGKDSGAKLKKAADCKTCHSVYK